MTFTLSPSSNDQLDPRAYVWAVALFLLTVATYIPSVSNGFIWDDPAYVVDNPTLKAEGAWGDAENLWRIWTDFQATPQYYPMVHTTFWIEARLWGTQAAAGYHVDNILLHALAAVLLWRALRSIGVPWPWLAAAVFAVHPVMVESVTWVTERKNVLSIVLYLLAFRAYRRSGYLTDAGAPGVHPGLISKSWYWRSVGLFLLALLSKTVTCSLPAAILLVIYWKRGRITWENLKPLLPMFGLGLVFSGITSHLEATRVGASGPDFQWSPMDRLLIAGHAICFYAGKLIWPLPLIFMYPHWDLHADRARQFIYPLIVGVVVATMWFARNRIGRGPLVAVLFFIGTLTPALGFVNVYPMRYSFVADHFQYLASIGVIVLFTSVMHAAVMHAAVTRRANALELVASATLLAPLIVLTWRQQAVYKNAHTLWANTIQQNEGCWMAHVNLASVLQQEQKIPEAIAQSERGLQLAPYEADTNYDVGVARAQQQRWAEAADMFRRAIRCDPRCAQAWSYLALVLWDHFGSPQDKADAVSAAQRVLDLDPEPPLSSAYYVLGSASAYSGNLPTAIEQFEKAVAIDEKNYVAHLNLGLCLLQVHRPGEAAGEFQKVIQHNPQDPTALSGMGQACLDVGKPSQAVGYFQRALAIDPNLMQARDGLKRALVKMHRPDGSGS